MPTIEELQKELEEARETIARLNRRCQLNESAAAKLIRAERARDKLETERNEAGHALGTLYKRIRGLRGFYNSKWFFYRGITKRLTDLLE